MANKKLDTERAINTIQTPIADTIVDPLMINDTFAAYHQILYKSDLSELEEELLFSTNSQSPLYLKMINPGWTVYSSQEILEAIKHMKVGKTAGPDDSQLIFINYLIIN